MVAIPRSDAAVKRLSAAVAAQLELVTAWLAELTAAEFEARSPRSGVRVADVVRHMLLDANELALTLGRETAARPVTLSAQLRAQRSDAGRVLALIHATLDGEPPAELVRQLGAAYDDVAYQLRQTVPVTLDSVHEPIRRSDLLRAACIELVSHCDDLATSLPGREPLRLATPTLLEAARGLAAVIEERQPGRSIELRVPPAVAVQIGDGTPGPVHTRGTPPSVVETDPLTFVRLCTGRIGWADAVATHVVDASGAHANLAPVFPV